MTGTVRVLVVDDETAARRRLMRFIAAHADLAVVGEARNGREACDSIRQLQPDLVFMDMEMPELNGLEVAHEVGAAQMPATIFATAYDHYAVGAFNANAIDYLLKPFDEVRFNAALDKARRWLGAGREQFRGQLDGAMRELRASPCARLLVRSGEVQHVVRTADIVYISAEGNYIRLHTTGGEHLMRERMAGILERLDGSLFRRIHRSHIVNLDHVARLLPWFGGDSLVMMSDGSRLTLSRSHRAALSDFA